MHRAEYGGACFAARDGVLRVARQVLAGGELPAVIVVSAHQGMTDQLSEQAQELGANPAHAARDLLLATGELQSAALLAAAVSLLGGRAEVVLPWSVFETTGEFGNATIEKVEVEPVLRCLGRGGVPIVPGFIGGTRDGRVTTLGRGGSDYSAVALGVALHAARVELCKAEVDGVYDADPQTHGYARRFDTLTYADALRISRSGAKVLQEKAAAPRRPLGSPGPGPSRLRRGRRDDDRQSKRAVSGDAVTAEAALGRDAGPMSPIVRPRVGVRPLCHGAPLELIAAQP